MKYTRAQDVGVCTPPPVVVVNSLSSRTMGEKRKSIASQQKQIFSFDRLIEDSRLQCGIIGSGLFIGRENGMIFGWVD